MDYVVYLVGWLMQHEYWHCEEFSRHASLFMIWGHHPGTADLHRPPYEILHGPWLCHEAARPVAIFPTSSNYEEGRSKGYFHSRMMCLSTQTAPFPLETLIAAEDCLFRIKFDHCGTVALAFPPQ